jgi:hypothetical protein
VLLVTTWRIVMRQIEKEMCLAIGNKKNWIKSNTRVEYAPELNEPLRACIEHARVYLWGNHIGTFVYSLNRFDVNKETLAKWPTMTTKSRLRALGAKV